MERCPVLISREMAYQSNVIFFKEVYKKNHSVFRDRWITAKEMWVNNWVMLFFSHWSIQVMILVWKASLHDANFVITGGTTGCHSNSLWCHQWWQSWHHGNYEFSAFSCIWQFIEKDEWSMIFHSLSVWKSICRLMLNSQLVDIDDHW